MPTFSLLCAVALATTGLAIKQIPQGVLGNTTNLAQLVRRRQRRMQPRKNLYEVSCTAPPCTVKPDEIDGRAYCSFKIETGEEKWPVCKMERPEHDMVRRHITPENTVLELGARYGTTTCEIASALKNSGKLVSVEPDSQVWEALQKNGEAHGCNFNLLKGTVGRLAKQKSGFGHGTRFSLLQTSTVETFGEGGPVPYSTVQDRFGLKFDTLLIDCEGCVNAFLGENPGILANINTIILEADMGTYKNTTAPDCGTSCVDYDQVVRNLEQEGFKLIDEFQERHGDRATMNPPECCPWAYHFAFKRV